MIVAAALGLAALLAVAGLVLDFARDQRRRRAALRRRPIDQARWSNPVFSEAIRPFGGVPPLPPTRPKDPECLPPKLTT